MSSRKLNRAQQVRLARQILQIGPAESEEIEAALTTISLREADHEFEKTNRSKSTKRAARTFLSALRRLELAHEALPLNLKIPYLLDFDFRKWAARTEKDANEYAGKPKRDAFKKEAAALEALGLLAKYRRPIQASRAGQWCRLAAVLYGERGADLYHQCRKLRPNPGVR